MLHIPNSAKGNCLTEKENHTLCLNKFANYQNIMVRAFHLRWLNTVLRAVSGNLRDGACFKLD